MAKTPIKKETIQETLQDQHRKTMRVVNQIKGDTAHLIETTNLIVDKLEHADMDHAPDIAEPVAPPPPEPPVPPRPQPAPPPLAPEELRLAERIAPMVVREVIQEIQPLLERLRQIASNPWLTPAQPLVDEPTADADAFAQSLIQRMERTLDERMKAALSRQSKMIKP
ncbi:MAG: hypothetical protein QNJ16_14460 [Rhodobacter sp.]|nr:hypothetical protein [Rhodobacter sp.]